jgi:hypothetical protein
LGGGSDNAILESYQLSIIPLNPNLDTFKLESEVLVSLTRFSNEGTSDSRNLPPEVLKFAPAPTIVSSRSRGIFIREVEVFIPQQLTFSNSTSSLGLQKGDSAHSSLELEVNLYTYYEFPQKFRVILNDFPEGAFYQAKNPENFEESAYLDTETYVWNPSGGKVKFSYIPPPFHGFSRIVKAFLWLNSPDD